MHDLDRTQAEFWETDGNEMEQYEWEDAGESYGGEMEDVFSEADEMEFAAELLEVSDEAELDQFLGSLFNRVKRTVGNVVPSSVTRQLGGMLKGLAKRTLPIAGGALGNLVAPGVGGAIGSNLASGLGSLFGLELEGLSDEDQEFEVARQFVRLAGAAAQNAAESPAGTSPQAVAQNALANAASQYAPGLLRQATGSGNGARPTYGSQGANVGSRMTSGKQSGRWVRRGNKIVLYGL